MKIDIISDTVCPWCLIGKRKLEVALAERPEINPTIRWRPFQLHPDIKAEGVDRQEAITEKFGSVENAQQIYQRVAEAGAEVGVEFNFDAIPKTPNTLNSHRLIYWAGRGGVQDRMVEILFRDFFVEGRYIGDLETLVAAGAEAGLDPDEVERKLKSDDDKERILSEEAAARRGGIESVPFFIFNQKYALSGAQPIQGFLDAFDKASSV